MSNAHVTNISSLKQLQEEEPNFNTVDWDNLNRMKYMRGRMVPDCWHMGSIDMSSELWNQGEKYEWIKYAFENYCPPLKKTTFFPRYLCVRLSIDFKSAFESSFTK